MPICPTHHNITAFEFAPMGICLSSRLLAASNFATAKLILQDGRLEEFTSPIRVSDVLRRYDIDGDDGPPFFICNSDEMEFDDVVLAVGDDEELQSGQLYFALPISQRGQPLTAKNMAALAVRASSALMMCPEWRSASRRKVVFPVEGPGDRRERKSSDVPNIGHHGVGGGGDGKDGRIMRGRRKFTMELSLIPE